jgi:tetratricopeptide (TPR) repeat protein
MTHTTAIVPINNTQSASLTHSTPAAALALIPQQAQGLVMRMFADPNALAKEERVTLVEHLRECIAKNPEVADLRVLYGMALCVNLDAQEAMEELGEAVALDPNSFIAHLKMGELWMRLRVCDKAQNHTQQAAALAQNLTQAELARRQAATLRTMMREGVDRGGYRMPWLSFARMRRLWNKKGREAEALATVDVG